MKKKTVSLIAGTMASLIALSACSADSKTASSSSSLASSSSEASSVSSEPFNITMIQELFSAQPPDMTNSWQKKLQEETNTTLDVMYSPTSGYVDKINVLVASSNLPMVIAMRSDLLKSNSIVTGIQNGAYWALDDYIDDYPNLKEQIGDDVWETSAIQGKHYGIPRLRILARNGMYYRKDWAEKLGISAPETLDDLYNMAKAFTEQDPDGNGKNDTWGMEFAYTAVGNNTYNGIDTITTALGGPNGWGYINNKMVPSFITDEYMTALDFFKKLYDENYMNKDFALLTGTKRNDVFNQGLAGMMGTCIDDTPGVQDTLQKVIPTASLAIAPVLKESDPELVNATAGFNGLIMFNKFGSNCIKTEEDLKAVLQFYEDACSEDIQMLIKYGIEGDHYTVGSDGKKALTKKEDGSVKLNGDIGDFAQLLPRPAFYEKDDDNEIKKEVYANIKARTDLCVLNPTISLTSDSYTQYGSELDKIILDADVKYIMGEIDKAGREAQIKVWREQGGDKIIEEYTAQYNLYNK